MSTAGARCLTVLLLASGAAFAAPEIRWLENRTAVEVTGIGNEALPAAGAGPEEWSRRFSVRTGDGKAPAMLGKWTVEGGTLRFTPRFPLSPGVSYEAIWQPAAGKAVTSRHLVPKAAAARTTVSHIYPGGATVPENLLKFYIHFSGPMSGGDVYRHIHVRNAAGKDVEIPFLEVAEELWNPEMTRLTVFIDPGRVKREVKPLEDAGPVLVAGQDFSLTIDAAWPDAAGQPLQQSAEKKFKVTAPDRTPPDPKQWKLSPPSSGTRDPLRISFTEPLDHALSLRLIAVTNSQGASALSDDGLQWSWTPRSAWRAGPYTVRVLPELEDLAGNSVGKPFEVDIAGTDKEPPRPDAKPVELPFTVK